jgi:hypothetical protein
MVAIENECKRMGWGHPEAHLQEQRTIDLNALPEMDTKTLVTPDGRLPKGAGNFSLDDIKAMEKSMSPVGTPTNPDGTLFETPKLEGSFLPRKKELEETE